MIIQVALFFTGFIAIAITQQSNDKIKKYAPIFGLLGQPFWLYTALDNGQYGIFALTLGYTYLWGLGFYNSWVKVSK